MKRKFKSDGHQFHQYQQNEQSPLILGELTEHKKYHDICCWDRHKNGSRLNKTVS